MEPNDCRPPVGIAGRRPANRDIPIRVTGPPLAQRRYPHRRHQIATWNVGGLKARHCELLRWLSKNQPDVMGLQEIRTGDGKFLDRFRTELEEAEGYRATFHGEPGRNGVAILSKQRLGLEVTQTGLPGQNSVDARLLTAHTAGLSFTTVCVPIVGKAGIERKLAWLDSLCDYLREHKNDNVPAVLCGDFNITPEPIDAYHHGRQSKERPDRAGFQKDERSRIRSLQEAGWFDLVRHTNPGRGMFSYWNSSACYAQNKGLRIDLVFGNRAVFDRLISAWTDCSPYEERGRTGNPDHAPVIVDLA